MTIPKLFRIKSNKDGSKFNSKSARNHTRPKADVFWETDEGSRVIKTVARHIEDEEPFDEGLARKHAPPACRITVALDDSDAH